jgi:hypothetical protein
MLRKQHINNPPQKKYKQEVRRIRKVHIFITYISVHGCGIRTTSTSPTLAVFKVTSAYLEFICSRIADKAGVGVALAVFGSNLGLTPTILTEFFFSSVPSGKFRDSASIRPLLLLSRTLIHLTSYHSTLYSLDTYCVIH